MKRVFRKQTHDDFMARLDRLAGHRTGQVHAGDRAETVNRGELEIAVAPNEDRAMWYGLLGFAGALCAFYAGANPVQVRGWIGTSLPGELQFAALAGATVGVTALLVLFVASGLRFLNRRSAQRVRHGGLLTGAILGAVLAQVPAPSWQAGYAALEDGSGTLSRIARLSEIDLDPVDWGSAALVSSTPK